jgi:uracil-DNA glycosylase family 4
VTGAARCAPPGNKPTTAELDACQPYLEAELGLLRDVRVVVGLGRIGWERWLRAAGWWTRLPPRERPTFGHAREAVLPDGTTLLASFHPSRQNTNTRRLTPDMWDAVFARARELVDGREQGVGNREQGAGGSERRRPSDA